MGSCLVEVGHILIQNTLESLLLQDQQVVQAFLPYTPHKAFADGVGSWRVNRRFEQLDATGLRHWAETGSKLAVVIMNEVLGCLPIRGGFSQLLCDPGISRRPCHSDMDHSSCFELDEEERKKRSKEQIADLEEVTGPDL